MRISSNLGSASSTSRPPAERQPVVRPSAEQRLPVLGNGAGIAAGSAQLARKVFEVNLAARCHHREPAARVLELTHVAGPVERLEISRHLRPQRLWLGGDLAGGPFEKVREQHGYVRAPFPQGGSVHADDVEAVEEILAERPGLHARIQILVRGRDNPYVDSHRHMTPDAVELAVGEHAKQACLKLCRHVADLVEEQGAPVGLFENGRPAGTGRR